MTEFPPAAATHERAKRNAFTRFLDGVEWLGNLLPHPVTLFALLALGIVLLSGLFGWMGVAVVDPRPAGAPGVAEDGMTFTTTPSSWVGAGTIVTYPAYTDGSTRQQNGYVFVYSAARWQ